MDHRKLREEALRALFSGGSYRDVVETEVTLNALDRAPEIPLSVPIRFRKRYEDMKNEAHPDSRRNH